MDLAYRSNRSASSISLQGESTPTRTYLFAKGRTSGRASTKRQQADTEHMQATMVNFGELGLVAVGPLG